VTYIRRVRSRPNGGSHPRAPLDRELPVVGSLAAACAGAAVASVGSQSFSIGAVAALSCCTRGVLTPKVPIGRLTAPEVGGQRLGLRDCHRAGLGLMPPTGTTGRHIEISGSPGYAEYRVRRELPVGRLRAVPGGGVLVRAAVADDDMATRGVGAGAGGAVGVRADVGQVRAEAGLHLLLERGGQGLAGAAQHVRDGPRGYRRRPGRDGRRARPSALGRRPSRSWCARPALKLALSVISSRPPRQGQFAPRPRTHPRHSATPGPRRAHRPRRRAEAL
jgi:hypothetical protein